MTIDEDVASVRVKVKTVAADVLELPVARILDDQPLVSLGLDSLGVVDLKEELDAQFEVVLPMGVVANRPTVSGLSDEIIRLQKGSQALTVETVHQPAFPKPAEARSDKGVPEFTFPRALVVAPESEQRRVLGARSLLPSSLEVLERGISERSHAGAQLHVRLRGEVVVDVAVGMAEEGKPMTSDSLMPWLCNNKPAIAIAFALLWQRGAVALDDAVAAVIPEFDRHGKADITFRQLLTHTAALRPDFGYECIGAGKAEMLERLCDVERPADAHPGLEAYYNAVGGFFLLGLAIERLAGVALDQYMESEVYGPLGMTSTRFRLSGEEFRSSRDVIAPLFHMAPVARVLPPLSTAEDFSAFLPGVTGFGPARDLSCVLQALLPRKGGGDLLDEPTKEALTAKHRVGLYDVHWGGFVSNGLGVVSDGSYFGDYCSPRTFGSQGWGSISVADPVHDLVIVLLTNGLVDGDERDREVVDSVYRDLGLDTQPLPAPRIVAVDPEVTPTWSAQALAEDAFWAPPR